MVIKELNSLHLDSFYDCFTELMNEGYGHFSPKLRTHFLTKDYPKANFRFWMERNIRKIFVVMVEEEVVGFIVGDNSYGGVAFISWFGLKKPYRRKGLGTKLLHEYEKYITNKGAHLIELFTFEELIEFYERHGFTEIGRRSEGYYGQKNVIMDKKVGEWSDGRLIKS
ncbi:MAG: GNAT family N-acetyltransferase [Candidatus Dojkabacteria bacterium]